MDACFRSVVRTMPGSLDASSDVSVRVVLSLSLRRKRKAEFFPAYEDAVDLIVISFRHSENRMLITHFYLTVSRRLKRTETAFSITNSTF